MRFRGCLAAIAPRQAETLELRTGVGLRHPYGRAAVARMLRVSAAAESRIERRAVAALRSAAKNSSCGAARQAGLPTTFLADLQGASLTGAPEAAALWTAHGSPAAVPKSSSGKAKARRGQAPPGGVPNTANATISPPLPTSGSGSGALGYIVLALLGASALLVAAVRRWRPDTAPEAAPPRAVGARPLELVGGSRGAARALDQSERHTETPRPSRAAVLEPNREIAACRRADERGDATAATNLGVLLEQRGDLDGALAAYRRADERGDSNGAFNLGCLLAERGDPSGAAAAFRRADERGDAAGASNLGILLERQGDLEGALEAYRRADQRGDAIGALNLGFLLASRGDLVGARAAYRRASERGDREVAEKARSALVEPSRRTQR